MVIALGELESRELIEKATNGGINNGVVVNEEVKDFESMKRRP